MVASNDIYVYFVTANGTTQGCGLYREHGLQILISLLTLCSLTFHRIKGLFWRSTILQHKARLWMSLHEVFRMSLYRLCEVRIFLECLENTRLGEKWKTWYLSTLVDLVVTEFCGGKFLFYIIYIATCGQKAIWYCFMFQQTVLLILYDHIMLFHFLLFWVWKAAERNKWVDLKYQIDVFCIAANCFFFPVIKILHRVHLTSSVR